MAVAGGLLTLAQPLPVLVAGTGLLTAGFFAVHGVASGWVPVRAHAGGIASGQAASRHLVAYYLASSVFGSVAGYAWSAGGWPGVVTLATALLITAGALALLLRGIRTLLAADPR